MKSRPYLLHMFNSTKNVSPFDVNMAYEAEIDRVISYTEVVVEDIYNLTQDTIFSRGPKGVRQTGIFIGGREFGMAIDMLNRARAAMVPPFEVSVFADPSGAITTAAALIACVEHCLQKQGHGMEGKRMHIFGGTGPVGVCAGILAARQGVEVYLSSRRGTQVAQSFADEYNRRFEVQIRGADSSSEQAINASLVGTHVVVGAAKAGVQVLSREQLAQARSLLVAADVNAVPPAGIEGVEAQDWARPLAGIDALALGALAIGNIKYQVHLRMFRMMKEADKPLYLDHQAAFDVARTVTREYLSDRGD